MPKVIAYDRRMYRFNVSDDTFIAANSLSGNAALFSQFPAIYFLRRIEAMLVPVKVTRFASDAIAAS